MEIIPINSLGLVGSQISERAMRAAVIVKSFNIIEEIAFQVISRTVDSAIGAFFFKELEEGLTNCIVKGVPLFGERLNNIQTIQKLPESKGSILRSSVGVEHKPERDIPGRISLHECSHNQISIRLG